MGHGVATYGENEHRVWKRILLSIEAALYMIFVADCFVGLANVGGYDQSGYLPAGGASLIVLLLIISGVHRLRCGPDYS